MNKVILTGRPTNRPEVRRTTSGKVVARWTLAVQRGNDKADFISCNAWDNTAEFAEKYVEKGRLYLVEGRIETGSYEKDNHKVYTTDVVVSHIEFCDKKSDKPQEDNKDEFVKEDAFMNIPDGMDEEFPFN